MCGVAGAADEEGFSGRSASESECTPTSTNPPSEAESEVTETAKGRGEDGAATDEGVGNEDETGRSPATEPSKEPPIEEPDVEPPFLNGLLEIHSKSTTEHILAVE